MADPFPRLAGQKRAYLDLSLEGYGRSTRPSGIMESVVEGLTPGALEAAVRHYAGQPPPTGPADIGTAREGIVARGEEIAHLGIPGSKVPGCVPCHGPGGEESHNEHYPLLAGQHPDYLANQLALFRADRRGESLYAHVMELNADGLSSEDIVAVSAYYASIPPTGQHDRQVGKGDRP